MVDYVGRKVKAILPNSYFYVGRCLSQTETKITILDREGKEVLLDINSLVVLEVLEWITK